MTANDPTPREPTAEEKTQVVEALATAPVIHVSAVHDNLDQEVIRVTCDRLKLRLADHLRKVENRRAWLAPLGIAVTTLGALCTTDFKDFLGIGKDVWHAVFLLSFLGSALWLAVVLFRLPRSESIDDVVNSLRTEPPPVPARRSVLEIIKAEYWTPKARLDVTKELRDMVVENRLGFTVSNAIKDDPDEGVLKKLTIHYKVDDNSVAREFSEGDRVSIP